MCIRDSHLPGLYNSYIAWGQSCRQACRERQTTNRLIHIPGDLPRFNYQTTDTDEESFPLVLTEFVQTNGLQEERLRLVLCTTPCFSVCRSQSHEPFILKPRKHLEFGNQWYAALYDRKSLKAISYFLSMLQKHFRKKIIDKGKYIHLKSNFIYLAPKKVQISGTRQIKNYVTCSRDDLRVRWKLQFHEEKSWRRNTRNLKLISPHP